MQPQDAPLPCPGHVSNPMQHQLHYLKPFHTAPHTHYQLENLQHDACISEGASLENTAKAGELEESQGYPEPSQAVLAELSSAMEQGWHSQGSTALHGNGAGSASPWQPRTAGIHGKCHIQQHREMSSEAEDENSGELI